MTSDGLVMERIDFNEILACCELCPRQCGVNRLNGELGFCRAGGKLEIYRSAPHFGEEPPISGQNGSGTIFFSRCTLRCLYCQNYPWSQEAAGDKYSAEALANVFERLADCGCHNWNLVSPTPWLPMILDAIKVLKKNGKKLPVVYNTSSYERVEILKALEGSVDIYLADLRYSEEKNAKMASAVGDYVEMARAAILEMWRQTGPLKLTPEGYAVSGLICRILVLPDLAGEACASLRWLADNIGENLTLSVMAQYTPAYKAVNMNGWNRKITYGEYRRVCREVEKCGFNSGWMQDYNDCHDKELIGFNMPAIPKNAELQMRNAECL